MTVSVNYQASETQRISERSEQDQIAGAGAAPNYIPAVDQMPETEETAVSVELTSNATASPSTTSLGSQSFSLSPTKGQPEDGSNYLLNRTLLRTYAKMTENIDATYVEGENLPVQEKSVALAPATAPDAAPRELQEYQKKDSGYSNHATYTVNATRTTREVTTTGESYDSETGTTSTQTYRSATTQQAVVTYTVTDPDGETHTFESLDQARAYIGQDAKQYGGVATVNINDLIIVSSKNGGYAIPSYSVEVFKDGQVIGSFASNKAAAEWLQNQHYNNADLSYFEEFNYLDQLDGNSSEEEFLNAVGKELDSTIENYDPNDFYYYDANGYKIVDAERLEAWYKKVQMLAALITALQMLMKAKQEFRDIVEQEMTGFVADKGMDTASIIGKMVQNRLAKVEMAVATLFQEVQEHNQEVYEREVEEAKKMNDSCPEKTADFITGGQITIDMLEEMEKDAENYLNATSKMQQAFLAITGVEIKEYGNGGTGTVNEQLDSWMNDITGQIEDIAHSGDNDFLELDDDELKSLRKGFFAIQNIRRAWSAINDSVAETRNLVHQEMTGVGGREKSKLDNQLLESEMTHQTTKFELAVNLTQTRIQLFNQRKTLQNEIEKAKASQVFNIIANVFMVAAIIVGIFIPPLGLAIGLAGAAIRLGGAIYADSLTEEYNPDLPSDDGKVKQDANTGDAAVDTINETENMEDEIIAQTDEKMIEEKKQKKGWFAKAWESISPGGAIVGRADENYKQLNTKAIAEMHAKLVAIQNIKRAILAIYAEKQKTRNLVHMEMTGIGGRDNSGFVNKAFESDMKQKQFEMEMRVFMLNEFKNAENLKIARAKKLAVAIDSFVISVGLQVGLYFVGQWVGEALSESASNAAAEGASEAAAEGASEAAAQGASEAAAQGAGEAAAQGAGEAAAQATAQGAAETTSTTTANATTTAAEQAAAQAIEKAGERGAMVGAGIGSALAGLLGQMVAQAVYGDLNGSYGNDGMPEYVGVSKKNNPHSVDARLDNLEYQIYQDLLSLGINTSVGGGYWGIDGAKISKLRNALGRIFYIRTAIATVAAAQQNMRNLVHMEMTGIAGRQAGELTEAVNQANFQRALKTMSYFTQYLEQRVEAHNKSVDARKKINDAFVKFGVDLFLAAAGVTAALRFDIAAFYYIISPVLQLTNSIYDVIVNYQRSKEGDGDLGDYNAYRTAREITRRNDPDSATNRLDQAEAEVYGEISQNLIEEVGGGRWGLNSGALSLIQNKMERIYNIRQALARLREAEAEARAMVHAAMTGVGGDVGSFSSAFAIDRAIAMANVADLFANIRTIVERHNQMNDASREMWQALATTVVNALLLWFAIEEIKIDSKNTDATKDAREQAENMTKAREQYKELLKNGAISSSADLEKMYDLLRQISAAQKKIAAFKEVSESLSAQLEQWQLYSLITSIAGSMSDWLVGIIYDSSAGSRESKADELRAQAANNNESQPGWAGSVSGSENRAVNSSIGFGEAKLDGEVAEIRSQQNEELFNGLFNTTMSLMQYFIKKNIKAEDIKNYIKNDRSEEKAVPDQTAVAAEDGITAGNISGQGISSIVEAEIKLQTFKGVVAKRLEDERAALVAEEAAGKSDEAQATREKIVKLEQLTAKLEAIQAKFESVKSSYFSITAAFAGPADVFGNSSAAAASIISDLKSAIASAVSEAGATDVAALTAISASIAQVENNVKSMEIAFKINEMITSAKTLLAEIAKELKEGAAQSSQAENADAGATERPLISAEQIAAHAQEKMERIRQAYVQAVSIYETSVADNPALKDVFAKIMVGIDEAVVRLEQQLAAAVALPTNEPLVSLRNELADFKQQIASFEQRAEIKAGLAAVAVNNPRVVAQSPVIIPPLPQEPARQTRALMQYAQTIEDAIPAQQPAVRNEISKQIQSASPEAVAEAMKAASPEQAAKLAKLLSLMNAEQISEVSKAVSSSKMTETQLAAAIAGLEAEVEEINAALQGKDSKSPEAVELKMNRLKIQALKGSLKQALEDKFRASDSKLTTAQVETKADQLVVAFRPAAKTNAASAKIAQAQPLNISLPAELEPIFAAVKPGQPITPEVAQAAAKAVIANPQAAAEVIPEILVSLPASPESEKAAREIVALAANSKTAPEVMVAITARIAEMSPGVAAAVIAEVIRQAPQTVALLSALPHSDKNKNLVELAITLNAARKSATTEQNAETQYILVRDANASEIHVDPSNNRIICPLKMNPSPEQIRHELIHVISDLLELNLGADAEEWLAHPDNEAVVLEIAKQPKPLAALQALVKNLPAEKIPELARQQILNPAADLDAAQPGVQSDRDNFANKLNYTVTDEAPAVRPAAVSEGAVTAIVSASKTDPQKAAMMIIDLAMKDPKAAAAALAALPKETQSAVVAAIVIKANENPTIRAKVAQMMAVRTEVEPETQPTRKAAATAAASPNIPNSQAPMVMPQIPQQPGPPATTVLLQYADMIEAAMSNNQSAVVKQAKEQLRQASPAVIAEAVRTASPEQAAKIAMLMPLLSAEQVAEVSQAVSPKKMTETQLAASIASLEAEVTELTAQISAARQSGDMAKAVKLTAKLKEVQRTKAALKEVLAEKIKARNPEIKTTAQVDKAIEQLVAPFRPMAKAVSAAAVAANPAVEPVVPEVMPLMAQVASARTPAEKAAVIIRAAQEQPAEAVRVILAMPEAERNEVLTAMVAKAKEQPAVKSPVMAVVREAVKQVLASAVAAPQSKPVVLPREVLKAAAPNIETPRNGKPTITVNSETAKVILAEIEAAEKPKPTREAIAAASNQPINQPSIQLSIFPPIPQQPSPQATRALIQYADMIEAAVNNNQPVVLKQAKEQLRQVSAKVIAEAVRTASPEQAEKIAMLMPLLSAEQVSEVTQTVSPKKMTETQLAASIASLEAEVTELTGQIAVALKSGDRAKAAELTTKLKEVQRTKAALKEVLAEKIKAKNPEVKTTAQVEKAIEQLVAPFRPIAAAKASTQPIDATRPAEQRMAAIRELLDKASVSPIARQEAAPAAQQLIVEQIIGDIPRTGRTKISVDLLRLAGIKLKSDWKEIVLDRDASLKVLAAITANRQSPPTAEVRRRIEEAITAVSSQRPAAAPPAQVIVAPKTNGQSPSTTVLLAAVDHLSELIDQSAQITVQVAAIETDLAEAEQGVTKLAASANEAATPAADQDRLLQHLVAKRDALVAQRSTLVKERQALETNIKRTRTEAQRAIEQSNLSLGRIADRLAVINREIVTLQAIVNSGNGTPEQMTRLESLLAEKGQLLGEKKMIGSAQTVLAEKIKSCGEEIVRIKQRTDALMDRLGRLSTEIAKITRQISAVKAQKTEASEATGRGEGNSGPRAGKSDRASEIAVQAISNGNEQGESGQGSDNGQSNGNGRRGMFSWFFNDNNQDKPVPSAAIPRINTGADSIQAKYNQAVLEESLIGEKISSGVA